MRKLSDRLAEIVTLLEIATGPDTDSGFSNIEAAGPAALEAAREALQQAREENSEAAAWEDTVYILRAGLAAAEAADLAEAESRLALEADNDREGLEKWGDNDSSAWLEEQALAHARNARAAALEAAAHAQHAQALAGSAKFTDRAEQAAADAAHAIRWAEAADLAADAAYYLIIVAEES